MTKVQGLIFDEVRQAGFIREVEVSITTQCHLRCNNCGFYIPQQPESTLSSHVIEELTESLAYLRKLNVRIGSLAVLGGEPSFDPGNLEKALEEFAKLDNIGRIEVVSHGLTPQNFTQKSFRLIHRLTISTYFDNAELIALWKRYIEKVAPDIELCIRADRNWDKWLGNEVVDDIRAQEMYDQCWYRKHCVTVERQRLFMCSRIAKMSRNQEGIPLNENTRIEDIAAYLNRDAFIPSCNTCVPMMGLPAISAGQQPDGRIAKMIPKALTFLKSELHEST